eukprot:9841691-Lingulodinium_polyedra.AAC.1
MCFNVSRNTLSELLWCFVRGLPWLGLSSREAALKQRVDELGVARGEQLQKRLEAPRAARANDVQS